MINKRAPTVLSSLVYFVMVGMVMSAEPTPDQMKELCERYNIQEPVIAYPDSTQYFIICAEKNAYLGDCGQGKCFLSQVGVCSTCPSTPTNICTGKSLGERVAVPDDCQKFYICKNEGSDPIAVTCPAYQHYSKHEKKCTSPLDAYCSPPKEWCNNKRDGLRFAAAKCFQYYECFSETVALKTCSYNQYFDKEKNECTAGVCKDENDGSTSEREPDCSVYEDGVMMAHPKCYKYYMCLNKLAYVGQCSTGYYFNVKSKSCIKDKDDECNDD